MEVPTHNGHIGWLMRFPLLDDKQVLAIEAILGDKDPDAEISPGIQLEPEITHHHVGKNTFIMVTFENGFKEKTFIIKREPLEKNARWFWDMFKPLDLLLMSHFNGNFILTHPLI